MAKVSVTGEVVDSLGNLQRHKVVEFRLVGPDGAIMSTADAAIIVDGKVRTDGDGILSVELPSNAEADQASATTGSHWEAWVSSSGQVWAFQLGSGVEGSTVRFGDGAFTVAPMTSPPWQPVAGRGLPAGGTSGQVAAKASDDDFDVEWVDPSGGPGSGVNSVTATNGVVNTGTPSDPVLEVSGLTLSDISDAGTAAAADTTDFRAASGRVDAADVDVDTTGWVASPIPNPWDTQSTLSALDGVLNGQIVPIIQGLGTSATKDVGTTASDVAAGDRGLPDPSGVTGGDVVTWDAGSSAPVWAPASGGGGVPDPTSEPDGQVLSTASGAAVWATPSGGGGGPIVGTGSPVGVVSAPPGTQYVDTDGTYGAWQWLKVSGTGTSGWQVTYGDTGWRDITSAWNSGMSAGDGEVELLLARRIGEVVRWFVRVTSANFGVDVLQTVFAVPAGFRHWSGNLVWFSAVSNPHTAGRSEVAIGTKSNGELRVAYGVGSGSQATTAELSYVTDQAWPTSLPGTAA